MTERKRMTQEEKQIAIAEALGWTGPFEQGWAKGMEREGGDLYGFIGTDPEGDRYPVPDYFCSRDAMLPEIAKMEKYQMSRFGHKLMERTGHWCCGVVPNFEDDCRDLTQLIATPADVLAEVYGLTLGLWKEGE